MLKIWGRFSSINVRKVVFTAQLLHLPFERVDAGEPLLTLLDTHLAQRPYMAGERLTMADIPIACEMHRWWGLPLEHPEHPHLRRWYEGLRQSPAARGAIDVPLS